MFPFDCRHAWYCRASRMTSATLMLDASILLSLQIRLSSYSKCPSVTSKLCHLARPGACFGWDGFAPTSTRTMRPLKGRSSEACWGSRLVGTIEQFMDPLNRNSISTTARRRTRRRAAGALTAAGAVMAIFFGGALLIGSVMHADLPRSLPEAALSLLSIAALMGCYGFAVCLSCRSFERAKSISYLVPENERDTARIHPAEMLRGSARPDLQPEEMLRATSPTALADSEQLVRPHSSVSGSEVESVILQRRSG